MSLKIHILLPNRAVGGGGARFLHAVRDQLRQHNHYSDSPDTADVILANSYHHLLTALRLKLQYPDKILLFRLGPLFSRHRHPSWQTVDKLVLQAAAISDGIIWQSAWSQEAARQLGFTEHPLTTVIHNAPAPTFQPPPRSHTLHQPIRLILTMWSDNPNKGAVTLSYLDNHLDWQRFQLTIIGNTPIRLQHAQHLSALSPTQLAEQLQNSDIYLAPMIDDACPNTVLEALACGLPVVGHKSGGIPELIGNAGRLFTTPAECLAAIESIIQNYTAITIPPPPTIADVAAAYYAFALNVQQKPRLHSHWRLWWLYRYLWLQSQRLRLLSAFAPERPGALP